MELVSASVKAAMMSLGRLSVGRAASRQQRHVARVASISDSSAWRRGPASAAATGRALVSRAKPPPRLPKGGRPRTASSLVPEKLVTMVPWVPAPLQPIMDKVHPIMIKERRPLAWLGMSTATNAGALCGHASFAILTAAYLETDVLTLR